MPKVTDDLSALWIECDSTDVTIFTTLGDGKPGAVNKIGHAAKPLVAEFAKTANKIRKVGTGEPVEKHAWRGFGVSARG